MRDDGSDASAVKSPDLLVLGLGNPILGDDGVGWRIVEEVAASINDPLVETDRLAVGGLSLMERLIGCRNAILVDAICTSSAPPGSLHRLTADDLPPAFESYTRSIHDTGLPEALAVGRSLNADLPHRIEIVAVEILPGIEFSESLTPPAAAAVPLARDLVLEMIQALLGRPPALAVESRSGG